MKNIVILGATSAIAKAVARQYAKEKNSFILVGRNAEKTEALKNDLLIRGATQVDTVLSDLNDSSKSTTLVAQILEKTSHIDLLFIAYGVLGDSQKASHDPVETASIMTSNFSSVVSHLSAFTSCFETQKSGSIAVISSVAGDRGRQSNYTYGAAKGGLSIYLQGLRHHLSKYQVQVLDIKPGFVDTPMTASFKKGLLWAQPEQAATCIRNAISKKKSVAYVPGFWKWIMLIIKLVPEVIFHKTNL